MPTISATAVCERGSARTRNDPDRHIRQVAGGRFQARPYCDGERYDLGTFPTISEARRAIMKFWWGELPALPKFTYRCWWPIGGFLARVRVDGVTVRLGWFEKREAAAAAVKLHLVRTYGKERAEELLKRSTRCKPGSRSTSSEAASPMACSAEAARDGGSVPALATRPPKQPGWIAEEVALLGTDDDDVIGKRIGRSAASVHAKRVSMQIPSFRSGMGRTPPPGPPLAVIEMMGKSEAAGGAGAGTDGVDPDDEGDDDDEPHAALESRWARE